MPAAVVVAGCDTVVETRLGDKEQSYLEDNEVVELLFYVNRILEEHADGANPSCKGLEDRDEPFEPLCMKWFIGCACDNKRGVRIN